MTLVVRGHAITPHEGLWRVRDDNGIVHHAMTVSHPVLVYDNNVDYADETRTFCGLHVGDWLEASPDEPTTCVACFAAWFKLEEASYKYFAARERDLCDDTL